MANTYAWTFGDTLHQGRWFRNRGRRPEKSAMRHGFEGRQLGGHLKPSELITHRIPLEHIAEGYHIFSSKLDDCIKTVVLPLAN